LDLENKRIVGKHGLTNLSKQQTTITIQEDNEFIILIW